MKKRFFILSISLTFISIIHAAQYIENPLIISTAEGGKIGVCCHSGLAERNAEYHVNSIFYRG